MRIDAIVYKQTENGIKFGRVTSFTEDGLEFKTVDGETVVADKASGDVHRVSSINELVQKFTREPEPRLRRNQIVWYKGALGKITAASMEEFGVITMDGKNVTVPHDDTDLIAVDDEHPALPEPTLKIQGSVGEDWPEAPSTEHDFEDDDFGDDDEDEDDPEE